MSGKCDFPSEGQDLNLIYQESSFRNNTEISTLTDA